MTISNAEEVAGFCIISITMKWPHLYLLIIFISLTMAATASVPSYAKPGCTDMCGSVRIPYPFGIGLSCSLNKWYAVDCNSSAPYLPALKNLPVLGIDLYEQMVIVNVPILSDCQTLVWNSSQILNVDLGETPFLFSKSHNKFIVENCGTASISSRGSVLAGCSTICSEQSARFTRNSCNGINCCQTSVPYYMDSYIVNVSNTSLHNKTGNSSCAAAFLVADNSYVDYMFPGQSASGNNSLVPVVLRWTLTGNDINEASCGYSFKTHTLYTDNDTALTSGTCSCQLDIEEGNPYLSGGCKVTEECTKCTDTWGLCIYEVSYGGVRNFLCDHHYHHGRNTSSRALFLGVGISLVVLILAATGFALYKVIRRTKDKRQRARFFERNGGLILKQQEAGNEDLVNKTKLFTSHELEKATDYFNENRILGQGGQGTVYKGMLTDGRIVAVKKSKAVDQSQLEQFINEVVILSQINHRNVVKLLGCCLETEVPLLVSEFIPNGTLYGHLHDETGEVFISLNMRLQIATEVAGALSYLHSATSNPIYHRDIKSTNILLDEKYRAKISDFGTSRFVSMSQTHLTTLVQGTIGYLDPEYFQTSQFTEKSDVYSFGVVLVELLTGEKPISHTRFGGNRSLATHFILAIEEGRVMSILDPNMVRGGVRDVLLEVASLAMRCLNLSGKNRPTMKEVGLELELIRMAYISSMVGSDLGKVKYNAGKEESTMLSYGESTSSSI